LVPTVTGQHALYALHALLLRLNKTNHGGVAVIAKPGINVSAVSTVSDVSATFEYVCARVTTGKFKAIVTVIYRPGSDAVEQRFFNELSSLFDVLASFQEPVFIVGDFNVRFERAADPIQRQFNELLASKGLSIRPTVPTHRDGGTIDAVIIREDMLDCASLSPSCLDVTVLDVGLSYHHLLTWSVYARQTQRQPPQTVITRRRTVTIRDTDVPNVSGRQLAERR